MKRALERGRRKEDYVRDWKCRCWRKGWGGDLEGKGLVERLERDGRYE